jgi:hypothetical protein
MRGIRAASGSLERLVRSLEDSDMTKQGTKPLPTNAVAEVRAERATTIIIIPLYPFTSEWSNPHLVVARVQLRPVPPGEMPETSLGKVSSLGKQSFPRRKYQL